MATLASRQPNAIPSPDAPDFAKAVKAILDKREGNTRDSMQRFVTVGELSEFGLLNKEGTASDLVTPQNSGDTDPPKPPTNLKITNNVITHILSWTNPADEDLSHIEVWRSFTQDRTQAELVTVATKPTETVTIGGVGPRENYYYWIRAVDYAGNYSMWCPNDQMGGELVAGEFAESINKLMAKLLDDSRYENIHTIVADSFRIIEPSIGLTEGKTVFATGNIDGFPTVGINGNLIVDGTVLSRMIATGAVSADKVSTTDTFTMTIQSNNYSPNARGFRINAQTGEAEFNAMKFKFQTGVPIPSEIDNGVVRSELLTKEAQLRAEIQHAENEMTAMLNGAVNDWNTTTIDGGRIKTGTLTANAVGANQICAYSANIKNGIINDAHIGSLSADKITTGSLNASLIKTGTLNADLIKAGTINANLIQENGIPISKINSGVVIAATGGGLETYTIPACQFCLILFNAKYPVKYTSGNAMIKMNDNILFSQFWSVDDHRSGEISIFRIYAGGGTLIVGGGGMEDESCFYIAFK